METQDLACLSLLPANVPIANDGYCGNAIAFSRAGGYTGTMSPSVFREKGYRFYFLSNEEDRVHIHVTCEDGEAKFWLEPIVSMAVSHGLKPRRLMEIQGIVEAHRDEIAKAWQSHFHKR